ncbi:MAG TPA: hypothetical protein VGR61_03415, partial [Candidatus Dormibacteraeota bacterium]|nr:hypothetical protein [Candidatus Dormibacteraeota bacterium]
GMALLTSAPALASYEDQGGSNCQQVGTNQGNNFVCQFNDANGQGVAGISVTFSQQSGPANCKVTFNPTSAVTDSSGAVKTTVTLPLNCPGSYVLAATTSRITVTATVREGGGFPATSANPPATLALNRWAPAALLAGILLMALGTGALVLRRH